MTSGFSQERELDIPLQGTIVAKSSVEVLKGASRIGSYPVRSLGLENPNILSVLDMVLTEGANIVEHDTFVRLQGKRSQSIRTISRQDWALVLKKVLEVNRIKDLPLTSLWSKISGTSDDLPQEVTSSSFSSGFS